MPTQNDVRAFINGEMALPFAWGDTDCCTMADRWVRRMTGFSPLARFGRVHQSEAEARQWLSEPGSIAVAVNRVMRISGFSKTATPRAGDVGLVVVCDRMAMAIFDGEKWFTRNENGWDMTDRFWKAWAIT